MTQEMTPQKDGSKNESLNHRVIKWKLTTSDNGDRIITIKDEVPQTVITGNFGDMYHYEIVGYVNPLAEEQDTYSWFDVFVDGERINRLQPVLADTTDALVYFIQWVANELETSTEYGGI